MKIRMLRSVPGSEDGILSMLYQVGKEYDVGDKLGNSFLKGEDKEPFAVLVEQKMKSPVTENKMLEPNSENKVEDQIEDMIYGKKKKVK